MPRVAASIAVAALVAFAVMIALVIATATLNTCDVFCAPPQMLVAALILAVVALVLWFAGSVLAAIAMGVTRAKSRIAWTALGLSLVIPVIVAISLVHGGVSGFVSP